MKATSLGNPELWRLLAMADQDLEQTDLVVANLTIAPDLGAGRSLASYTEIVDGWTNQFKGALSTMEYAFHQTPHKWKSDIRFFRIGMLQGFLGHEIGLRYIDQQKHSKGVRYTNPSDLFLDGLIETHEGTCANMPVLHVAISRRMGWPVSLACVGSHFISRFDDGDVVHNIEATDTAPGAFASGTDEEYTKRYNLPRRAITCGSDLRCLSMREMVGVFVALRARHLRDIGDLAAADAEYSLARTLFPSHRHTYISSMIPMMNRGAALFEPGEIGHPDSLPPTCRSRERIILERQYYVKRTEETTPRESRWPRPG